MTRVFGSPVEINNRVPASQVRFPQFYVLNIFASKVKTSAVIVGHSCKGLQIIC